MQHPVVATVCFSFDAEHAGDKHLHCPLQVWLAFRQLSGALRAGMDGLHKLQSVKTMQQHHKNMFFIKSTGNNPRQARPDDGLETRCRWHLKSDQCLWCGTDHKHFCTAYCCKLQQLSYAVTKHGKQTYVA